MGTWLNIPNILSGMRILTIPIIVLLIVHSTPYNYPVLILVFFFSIMLDFFDGYLARKLSQETKLGQGNPFGHIIHKVIESKRMLNDGSVGSYIEQTVTQKYSFVLFSDHVTGFFNYIFELTHQRLK